MVQIPPMKQIQQISLPCKVAVIVKFILETISVRREMAEQLEQVSML